MLIPLQSVLPLTNNRLIAFCTAVPYFLSFYMQLCCYSATCFKILSSVISQLIISNCTRQLEKSCRFRWVNKLGPNLKKWSSVSVSLLMQVYDGGREGSCRVAGTVWEQMGQKCYVSCFGGTRIHSINTFSYPS